MDNTSISEFVSALDGPLLEVPDRVAKKLTDALCKTCHFSKFTCDGLGCTDRKVIFMTPAAYVAAKLRAKE